MHETTNCSRSPAYFRFSNTLANLIAGTSLSNFKKYIWYSFSPHLLSKDLSREINIVLQHTEGLGSNGQAFVQVTKTVPAYQGRNKVVLRLKNFLEQTIGDHLRGAYLHGSLATNEEINYSDLDAVLILRKGVLADHELLAEVTGQLIAALGILKSYDPLQHHGFFVLTELDLSHYHHQYFPIVLFDHAKSLFDDKGLRLSFNVCESACLLSSAFNQMASAVNSKIQAKQYPRNYYELKLLMSQVMLLPTLYLHAKGQYVFKKHSFDIARNEFDAVDWQIMDVVSEMRQRWDFLPSGFSQFLQHRVSNHFFITLYQKRIGQRLSILMRSYLTPSFYLAVVRLVKAMQSKIERYELGTVVDPTHVSN